MTDKQSFEVNARFEYGACLTPNAKCKNINIEELKSQLKRAEQENKRLLEIINAKPLETVDIDSFFEIEKLKEQLKCKEKKLDKIQTICEKETTKSTFLNGIENKDLQKLAIKILKIIEGKNNG